MSELWANNLLYRRKELWYVFGTFVTLAALGKLLYCLVSRSRIHDVCEALCSIRSRVLSWPDLRRQQEISEHFEAESNIPGIIDGTHITYKDYINRNEYPSIQLQVIVDHMLLVTDSFVGLPGCTHDSRVFRNSSIYDELENGILNPNTFIIGITLFYIS